MSKTLREIAAFIDGELLGDGAVLVKRINGIQEAKEGDLAFIANSKDWEFIDSAQASCIVVSKDIKGSFDKPLIKVKHPSVAFSKIIEFISPDSIPRPKGIHETAVISSSAVLGNGVCVGPYAVIGDRVSIGEDTVIYPFSYVGNDSKIGKNSIIYPHVIIRESVLIGNRVMAVC